MRGQFSTRYSHQSPSIQERTHACHLTHRVADSASGQPVPAGGSPRSGGVVFAAALHRDGQTACLAAGMLWHVHGRSDDTFDWDQRPLFLRFNTDDHAERIAAFRELCGLLGVDPQPYLARA